MYIKVFKPRIAANEPINEYQLDKKALTKAQKTYENSTIQHQKVQSKSIITITKNEKKVLATIDIYQNWALDSLEERFKPIEDEAKAKLTYFDNRYQVKPHLYNMNCGNIKVSDWCGRVIGLTINKGKSRNDAHSNRIEIPLIIDYNGISLNEKSKTACSRNRGQSISFYKNENGIVLLKSKMINGSKKFCKSEVYLDFNTKMITDKDKMEKLAK